MYQQNPRKYAGTLILTKMVKVILANYQDKPSIINGKRNTNLNFQAIHLQPSVKKKKNV